MRIENMDLPDEETTKALLRQSGIEWDSLEDTRTFEARFKQLDESVQESLMNDARHLSQRLYALTGCKENRRSVERGQS